MQFNVGDKVRVKSNYDPRKSVYYSPHPTQKGTLTAGVEFTLTGVDFHTVTYQYTRHGKVYNASIENSFVELATESPNLDDTQVICLCPTPLLVSAGCKCGAFQKEQARKGA